MSLNCLRHLTYIFRPVNSEDGLIVESKLIVNVNIECNFLFSVYDSIDKDYSGMGSSNVNTQVDLEVEVLITFVGELDKIGVEVEVDYVEVELQSPVSIDFGYIEPDWGDGEYDY